MFRKVVFVLINFAVHVEESVSQLNQHDLEIQKQTETQEQLFHEVQQLTDKLKLDREDLDELKDEFSDVPTKIQNLTKEKNLYLAKHEEKEIELMKINEELEKIRSNNKPLFEAKAQKEEELQEKLNELCEDSTLQDMIKDTKKTIQNYQDKNQKIEDDIKQKRLEVVENNRDLEKIQSNMESLCEIKNLKTDLARYENQIAEMETLCEKKNKQKEELDKQWEIASEETKKHKKSANEYKRNSLLEDHIEEFNRQEDLHLQEMEKLGSIAFNNQNKLEAYSKKSKFLKNVFQTDSNNKENVLKMQAEKRIENFVKNTYKEVLEVNEKYRGLNFLKKDQVQYAIEENMVVFKKYFEN